MNTNKKRLSILITCSLLSITCLTAFARTQEVTAWRGETVAAKLDDTTEVGDAPEGFGVRIGSLYPVAYATGDGGLTRVEKIDRVDWDDLEGNRRMVEITVPPDAKPGIYDCGMLRIRVIDRVLPPAREWKYYLDLWQHPWAVARVAQVKPFSFEHYKAMKPLWEMLAAAGQKTLTVTLVDEPWNHQCRDAYHSMIIRTRRADGTWKFDYSIFDEYVAFGKNCGLGPDIACYTMCPWEYVCRYWKEGEGDVTVKAKPGTPEFEDFWGDFLVDFAAHLKAKGWFENTLIAMDERSPEDVRIIADFIQKKAPGLRISMAGNRAPSDFEGITIDSYSQVLTAKHVTTNFLAEAAARREKGLVTTHYVCCWPHHPNTCLNNNVGEAFFCGVYPAFAGLDGFLRWAYNSWPNNPMKDASFGSWLPGDTFLVYPDGSPSRRFLELKAGIIAAEKIRILREKGEKKAELDALSKKFDVKEANGGKMKYAQLAKEVMKVVNE